MTQPKSESKPDWTLRRRMMFTVVLFSGVCICWALFKDTDTNVMQTAVTMGFNTLIAITGTYVFGAVWDDKRK